MLAQGTLDFRSIKFQGKVWQTGESHIPPLFPEADGSNPFNLARYHQTSTAGLTRDGLARTDDVLAKIVPFFYARLPRRRFGRAERKEKTLETGTINGKGKDGGDKEFPFPRELYREEAFPFAKGVAATCWDLLSPWITYVRRLLRSRFIPSTSPHCYSKSLREIQHDFPGSSSDKQALLGYQRATAKTGDKIG